MILDQKLFPMDHAKPKSLDPDKWCTEGARSFVIAFVVCFWIFLGSACFHFGAAHFFQPTLLRANAANRTRTGSKCEAHDLTWPKAIKHLKGKKDSTSFWRSNFGQHHQHRSQFHPISLLFACNPKTLSLWGCKAYESDSVRL